MAKFTAGPWEYRVGGNFVDVWCEHYSGEGEPSAYKIADMNYRQDDKGENTPAQAKANARLVSAAPDLYNALWNMIALAKPIFSDATQMLALSEATAALYKAEGK